MGRVQRSLKCKCRKIHEFFWLFLIINITITLTDYFQLTHKKNVSTLFIRWDVRVHLKNKMCFPVSSTSFSLLYLELVFRVQYFSQRHFEMQTRGVRDWTTDPLVSGWSAVPPEPQPSWNLRYTRNNGCCHCKGKSIDLASGIKQLFLLFIWHGHDWHHLKVLIENM